MPKIYSAKKGSRFYIASQYDIYIMFAPIRNSVHESFMSSYQGYFQIDAQYYVDVPFKETRNPNATIYWNNDTTEFVELEEESVNPYTIENVREKLDKIFVPGENSYGIFPLALAGSFACLCGCFIICYCIQCCQCRNSKRDVVMKVPESKVAKFKKPPKEVLSKKEIKAFEKMVEDRIDR
jgi:hypothetical protein